MFWHWIHEQAFPSICRNNSIKIYRSFTSTHAEYVERFNRSNVVIERNSKKSPRLTFKNSIKYFYRSGEKINTSTNISLIDQFLTIKLKNSTKDVSIEVEVNSNRNRSCFTVLRKLSLSDYIDPILREKKLESSFIIRNYQFVSSFTTLGYLEAVAKKSFKIVRVNY